MGERKSAMKKKLLTVLLIIVMTVALTACKGGTDDETEPENKTDRQIHLDREEPDKEEKKSEKESGDEDEAAELPEASRPYRLIPFGYGVEEGEGVALCNHVKSSVNSSGTEIPDEPFLYDFLIRYSLFAGGSYDAEDPANSSIMVRIASDDLVNYSVYGFGDFVEYTKESDPRGWGNMETMISDRDAVDWLASNIFNMTDEGIGEAVSAAEDDKYLYAEGDKYYGLFIRTGIGIVPSVDIKECVKDGDVYWLAFDRMLMGKPENDIRYAKTEYKTIDGIEYWTLHSFSKTRPEEMPA